MRFQRNTHRGSRPEGVDHPRATQQTAESFHARFIQGGSAGRNLNRLFRLRRLERRDGPVKLA
jgi:hypothetical protein